jgi:hypothetical protein
VELLLRIPEQSGEMLEALGVLEAEVGAGEPDRPVVAPTLERHALRQIHVLWAPVGRAAVRGLAA